jgi:hypothetical protein
MRESRKHGSVRGARGATRVPTATQTSPVHHAPQRGGSLAARGARAAGPAHAAIGVLMPGIESHQDQQARLTAFHQGLAKADGLMAATSRLMCWGAVDIERMRALD